MTPLTILKGDATSPQAKGPKVIAHVCNDIGGWGKGWSAPPAKRVTVRFNSGRGLFSMPSTVEDRRWRWPPNSTLQDRQLIANRLGGQPDRRRDEHRREHLHHYTRSTGLGGHQRQKPTPLVRLPLPHSRTHGYWFQPLTQRDIPDWPVTQRVGAGCQKNSLVPVQSPS